MKNQLDQLNKIPGVDGSMVITKDGIMVAADLGPDLREDAVAALSSALVITLKRTLHPLGQDVESEELVLCAALGKLVFLNLGQAYLVVVTKPNLRLDTDLVEIRGVARKLRSRLVMS